MGTNFSQIAFLISPTHKIPVSNCPIFCMADLHYHLVYKVMKSILLTGIPIFTPDMKSVAITQFFKNLIYKTSADFEASLAFV